jgi:hypothetical protein
MLVGSSIVLVYSCLGYTVKCMVTAQYTETPSTCWAPVTIVHTAAHNAFGSILGYFCAADRCG